MKSFGSGRVALGGAVLFGAAATIWWPASRDSAPPASAPVVANPATDAPPPAPEAARADASPDGSLAAILSDSDHARRAERLRRWADEIDPADMPAELKRLAATVGDPKLRALARQALLYSWTSRDLVAMSRWLGTVEASAELQQEGSGQLVEALLQFPPAEVVPALREALAPGTARPLYGPYFRAWSRTAPAEAGAMLLEMARTEPGNPEMWNDLLVQVAAQWAQTDLPGAVAWVHTMPPGLAKAAAEIQISHRWAEVDPAGAAANAAKSPDPRLARAVSGKWAEAAPQAALAWAQSLPPGHGRDAALSGTMAAWAAQAPREAAAHAESARDAAIRSALVADVATAWAFSDPQAAASWVKTLPADASRDAAVGTLCDLFRFNAPEQAFAQAAATFDPLLRNSRMESMAGTWLKQDPAAARAAIHRSPLSDESKTRLLSQAEPPTLR